MVHSRNHASQLRMVDDVFSRVRAKRVVDGNGKEALRHASQIGNLPLRSVLTPQAHTVI